MLRAKKHKRIVELVRRYPGVIRLLFALGAIGILVYVLRFDPLSLYVDENSLVSTSPYLKSSFELTSKIPHPVKETRNVVVITPHRSTGRDAVILWCDSPLVHQFCHSVMSRLSGLEWLAVDMTIVFADYSTYSVDNVSFVLETISPAVPRTAIVLSEMTSPVSVDSYGGVRSQMDILGIVYGKNHTLVKDRLEKDILRRILHSPEHKATAQLRWEGIEVVQIPFQSYEESTMLVVSLLRSLNTPDEHLHHSHSLYYSLPSSSLRQIPVSSYTAPSLLGTVSVLFGCRADGPPLLLLLPSALLAIGGLIASALDIKYVVGMSIAYASCRVCKLKGCTLSSGEWEWMRTLYACSCIMLSIPYAAECMIHISIALILEFIGKKYGLWISRICWLTFTLLSSSHTIMYRMSLAMLIATFPY